MTFETRALYDGARWREIEWWQLAMVESLADEPLRLYLDGTEWRFPWRMLRPDGSVAYVSHAF